MRPYVNYSHSYFPNLHASGTAREFTVAGIVSPNSPKLLAEKRFEIRAENPLFFVAYGNRETGQIRFIIKEEKARFSYAPCISPAGDCSSSQANKQGGKL